MNILIVLLGCHIAKLLNGRVESSVQFASNQNNTVDWFLTGGVKYDENTISEADQMKTRLSSYNETWNYILDTTSTNTAENFIAVSAELKQHIYENVYVVTSEFHYDRASLLANKLIPNNNFKWILSDAEMPDSRYLESVHIKNVDADVAKAKYKHMIA